MLCPLFIIAALQSRVGVGVFLCSSIDDLQPRTMCLPMDVHAVRSDFPALDNYIWFQNGGVSITPKPVAESHLGYMNELLQRGPMHIIYPEEEDPRREQTMQCLADCAASEGVRILSFSARQVAVPMQNILSPTKFLFAVVAGK